MATKAQVQSFISLIAPVVQKKCKERGWGIPSAIIAQAGIESAWGTSSLWKSCYNGWGMKWKSNCGCDYKEYKTQEQKADGTYYIVSAKFRKYPSVEAGIEGYFKFIESYSRYKPVIASKTYEEYATQLKSCGWATSLKYASNIINTVKSNGLTKYDNVGAVLYYPKYTGFSLSIVTALKEVGETDTTISHRKLIALANGIAGYNGTSAQNTKMVTLLRKGLLLKG